jgi:vacuolar-type H+-ATPase subunit I/STV1
MKDQNTINQFITQRAQGLSLQKIADNINTCKPTLIEWNAKYSNEIDQLRQAARDQLNIVVIERQKDQLKLIDQVIDRYKTIILDPKRIPEFCDNITTQLLKAIALRQKILNDAISRFTAPPNN